MDIVIKYKIISEIINSNDDVALNSVKSIMKIEDEDFWDELSAQDQEAINDGISQLDSGQSKPHHVVRKEIKEHFNF